MTAYDVLFCLRVLADMSMIVIGVGFLWSLRQ